jgi:superfamily I DNA and RNA helicase
MVDTIWGSTNKPVSSKKLAERIEQSGLSGTLYIGYPILGTPSGAFPFDAVLLSPEHGVVVFDVVEGMDVGDYRERQDEYYTKLQARLMQYPSLVRRRTLAATITTITYAPTIRIDPPGDADEYPIFGRDDELINFVTEIEWPDSSLFPALAGAIQALSTIRKGRRRREIAQQHSRGDKLRKLEDSIANLDSDQGAAVIETVEGVQRIRGLAGSGKTIVLALKVAYLHAQHPDWRIAVTFNTRSLKGQFERLINTFTIEQTNEEPDWDRIEILNAWGAPGTKDRAGLYYKFCAAHGVPYYDFRSAQLKFGGDREFQGACQEALDLAKAPVQSYDAILVDEAQDFPPQFLRLCYSFLRPPKRLVYAYDELQSLTNTSLPPPEELFGHAEDGTTAVVSFAPPAPGEPKQDIILERCYRNSRPILATAHALGFGIYRKPGGLVQFFDQHQLWLDVGYRVHAGELEDNHFVSLERTSETSPKFLESHSPIEDLLVFKSFPSPDAQDAWLVEEIERNIRNEELLPEDIIIINPEPLKTRKAVASARSMLFSKGINSSLAGVSGPPDIFFESDTVTFTGIFRAKGNEAAMVYVINAHDCYHSYSPANLARIRNQLFTAITRSKAWVRVLGVGSAMDQLIAEYGKVAERDYRLEFKYPDAETRKKLRIISRDITRKRSRKTERDISELRRVLESIEAGDVEIEDLPPSLRRRLGDLFGGAK